MQRRKLLKEKVFLLKQFPALLKRRIKILKNSKCPKNLFKKFAKSGALSDLEKYQVILFQYFKNIIIIDLLI